MKNIKMKRLGFSTAFIILLIFAALIYWSPYGIKSKLKKRGVVSSIIIDAPIEEVYQYLGNSKNASQWSVFVDSIIPLNHKHYRDGSLGSLRRCFADNECKKWDEKIVALEEYKLRELSVFNLSGFFMGADNLRTQQLYEELNNKQSKLSLTLFYQEEWDDLLDEIKLYVAAYEISKIFELNLKNIKRLNEC